jgi:hypothetical protein
MPVLLEIRFSNFSEESFPSLWRIFVEGLMAEARSLRNLLARRWSRFFSGALDLPHPRWRV